MRHAIVAALAIPLMASPTAAQRMTPEVCVANRLATANQAVVVVTFLGGSLQPVNTQRRQVNQNSRVCFQLAERPWEEASPARGARVEWQVQQEGGNAVPGCRFTISEFLAYRTLVMSGSLGSLSCFFGGP